VTLYEKSDTPSRTEREDRGLYSAPLRSEPKTTARMLSRQFVSLLLYTTRMQTTCGERTHAERTAVVRQPVIIVKGVALRHMPACRAGYLIW
jgi:hypothetical protein